MFENIGYFKEYYVNNKFIGAISCELDEQKIGYNGRINKVLQENITLSNGKKIKSGTEVSVFMYPLCGKIQK